MKLLIIATLLATVTAASAQGWNNPPKTITFSNKQTHEKIGTATISENRIYLRDRNGEHYATAIKEADGTTRIVDPHGQPIDTSKVELPILDDVK